MPTASDVSTVSYPININKGQDTDQAQRQVIIRWQCGKVASSHIIYYRVAKFIGFSKNKGGWGKFWIKSGSFNGHQRKFNTFFAFTGDLTSSDYYSYNVIK